MHHSPLAYLVLPYISSPCTSHAAARITGLSHWHANQQTAVACATSDQPAARSWMHNHHPQQHAPDPFTQSGPSIAMFDAAHSKQCASLLGGLHQVLPSGTNLLACATPSLHELRTCYLLHSSCTLVAAASLSSQHATRQQLPLR